MVLQRTLRADPTSLANVGSVLVSAWFVCLLLLGPVLLAMRFLPLAGRLAQVELNEGELAIVFRGGARD